MPIAYSTIRNTSGPLIATPRDTPSIGNDCFRATFSVRPESGGLYGPLDQFESRQSWIVDELQYAVGDPVPEIDNNIGSVVCRPGVWHCSMVAEGECIVETSPVYFRHAQFSILTWERINTSSYFVADSSYEKVVAWENFGGGAPVAFASTTSHLIVPSSGLSGSIGARISNNHSVHQANFEFTISAHWVAEYETDPQNPG